MIFKESSNVTYALYKGVQENITLDNIANYVGLVNRDNFIYYKIEDIELNRLCEEYDKAIREDKPLDVDIVRFNHIFSVVKRYCQRERKKVMLS